jgi:IS5 family transposase
MKAPLTPIFEGRACEGRVSEEFGLFGVAPKLASAGIGAAGAIAPTDPADGGDDLPKNNEMKHAYNESHDSVCERWARDVSHRDFLWAYFQIAWKGPAKVSSLE